MQKTFATVVFLSLLGCGTGVLAQGLVARYEFEGEFCDSSGNELHGIPIGDAAIVFDEERDSDVLVLDGAVDTVMLGSDPLFDWTGAFSAAFWMKVEAWQESWDTVLKKESVFSFERNQASEELAFYHWPNFHSTTVGVAANGWHHIAATFDGLEQNIYLDGKLVSTVENTGEMNINSDPVYIGSNGSSRYFNGLVDDVQIYDVALSAEEIEDLAESIEIDPGPGDPGPGDPEPAVPQFVRGDSDDNGLLNLTAACNILNFLFLGGASPSCFEACDVDNNGILQLTDGIFMLNFLFLGGEAIPAPRDRCGPDPASPPDNFDCETFNGCP
ncbi:MAG: LamG domain-containing protein [Planctomycetes bacterium]|nr:LamG domain-containing protein [Planctomycetota bacterium]